MGAQIEKWDSRMDRLEVADMIRDFPNGVVARLLAAVTTVAAVAKAVEPATLTEPTTPPALSTFVVETCPTESVYLAGPTRAMRAVRVQSESDPTSRYEVTLAPNGGPIRCSCQAGARGKACKHLYRASVVGTGVWQRAFDACSSALTHEGALAHFEKLSNGGNNITSAIFTIIACYGPSDITEAWAKAQWSSNASKRV